MGCFSGLLEQSLLGSSPAPAYRGALAWLLRVGSREGSLDSAGLLVWSGCRVEFRVLGRKPCPVHPVPTTMTLSGAIPLLGGVLVEPSLCSPLGLVSLGENLDLFGRAMAPPPCRYLPGGIALGAHELTLTWSPDSRFMIPRLLDPLL
jgi:hypothetical protein